MIGQVAVDVLPSFFAKAAVSGSASRSSRVPMLSDLRPEGLAPRLATEADADTVTRVLVDAFRSDAMWGAWAFPKRHSRRANRHLVFRAFVAGALRYPATWIASGDTAIAMWIPPRGTGLTTQQEVQLEADLRARIGPSETSRILGTLDTFAAMEPTQPHYYLSLLGTDPASAGRGYGQRLLRHNLAAIDKEDAASYLDCADELVPFYMRFGFGVIGSLFLPDGPRSNGMWRPPRGGRLR
jgi:GNAT superfamily N-acetyltransferase